MDTMAINATTTPRWGTETLDRIAAVYDLEVLKYGAAGVPGWSLLPLETRLAVLAVYYAGRNDAAVSGLNRARA
jgi:hypothetical protein